MTQTATPAPVAISHAAPDAPAVERAFQLGWSLAELKGRVAIEANYAAGTPDTIDGDTVAMALTDPLSQDLWRGSMWRVAFDRVSSLHASFTTFRPVPNETLYDPGDKRPNYLFPDLSPDYAMAGALWPDEPANLVLPEFRLREATRRALNCLDLLYLEPKRTIQSDTIAKNQAALLEKLAVLLDDGQRSKPRAIVRLTRVTLTLLDTWDAYLREQFADVGWNMDSEHNLIAYEAGRALAALSWNLSRELLAVESKKSSATTPLTTTQQATTTPAASASSAASSMPAATPPATPATTPPATAAPRATAPAAAGTSGATITPAPAGTPATSGAPVGSGTPAGSTAPAASTTQPASSTVDAAAEGGRSGDPFELAWQEGFSDRNVSYLQHMLSVLGQALDTADSSEPKPSTTLRAVIRSIELWQRSVLWLCDKPARVRNGLGDATVIDNDLRVALIEQSAIWQALILGQEDLTSYASPGVAQRLYLEATIEVERAINPAQLGAIGAQVVRYGGEVLNDIEIAVHETLDKVVNDATTAASQAATSIFRQFWPWLVGVGAVLGMMLIVVFLASPQNPVPTLVNGLGGLVVGGLAFLHIRSVSNLQTDQTTQFTRNVLASVNTARATATTKFQDARTTVSNAIGSARTDAQNAAAAATAPSGVPAQLISGLSGKAGALLQYVQTSSENALTKAQDEVQNTVSELEQVIAISYPLIDFVVARTRLLTGDTHPGNAADSTYNFLDRVVWTPDDRKQELLQVASAAFGPLGVIALASIYGEAKNGHDPVIRTR